MNRHYLFLTLILVMGSVSADNAAPFNFEFERLAEGVWAGVRPDAPRYPVMGNVTFVIGDDGAVVFDGGGMPVMAEQTIAKIRSLTDKPVTHVIISHWHGDHSFGIWRYVEEFPNVQVVTHVFTDKAQRGDRVDYISNYATFKEKAVPIYQGIVDTGKDREGNDLTESEIASYQRILDDADVLAPEFKRARLTQANIVFDQSLIIYSGERRIELLNLGHGNTEGDIVMLLPAERIVSVGDLVVLPSPYAFNMPPRQWSETLQRINDLDYRILVPGHGAVQHDTDYVDLLIEVGTDIADQRDALVDQGIAEEEIGEKLDFSSWENRFTGGSMYRKSYYDAWFEEPMRAAAVKELSGKPMVEIGPSKRDQNN